MTRPILDINSHGEYSKFPNAQLFRARTRGGLFGGGESAAHACVCIRPLQYLTYVVRSVSHAFIRKQSHIHFRMCTHFRLPIWRASTRRGVCMRTYTLPRLYISLRTPTHIGGTCVAISVWRPNEGRQASKLGRAGAARAAILLDSGWKASSRAYHDDDASRRRCWRRRFCTAAVSIARDRRSVQPPEDYRRRRLSREVYAVVAAYTCISSR